MTWIAAAAGSAVAALVAIAPVRAALVPENEAEQRLWSRAREEQQVIDRSGFVFPELEPEDYLSGIVDRLVEADGFPAGAFRVRIVKDSTLNAFAFPHGAIYIHTGLLARLHNEAQVAAVLAHEVTHPINHHTWRQVRNLKNKTAWMAGTSALSGGITNLLGGLATLASVSGYSRAMETEADNIGFLRMVGAGYDTGEAHVAFGLLLEDLRRHKRKEPFFFGSHPKLAERESNYRHLHAARQTTDGGEQGTERFRAHTLSVLLLNAELEMRAGRFDAAREQVRRYVTVRAADPRACWVLGETERLAGEGGDPTEARLRCEEALRLDAGFAPAERSLGLLHFHAGAWAEAALHLRRFLDLEPEATDRAYLENYLHTCVTAVPSS